MRRRPVGQRRLTRSLDRSLGLRVHVTYSPSADVFEDDCGSNSDLAIGITPRLSTSISLILVAFFFDKKLVEILDFCTLFDN